MKKEIIRYVIMAGRYTLMLSLMIMASSALLSAKEGYGQKLDPQKIFILLRGGQQPVADIFKDIERQTAFRFIYNAESFNPLQHVDVNLGKVSVAHLLMHLSNEAGLEFKQIDNYFSVRKKGITSAPLPPIKQNNKGVTRINDIVPTIHLLDNIPQNKMLEGKVTDTKGNPLTGVTVQVKGTTNGAVTDVQGRFSLDVPDNAVLVVSSIGFQTQEIKVGDKTNLTIELKASASGLNEVVVVGYGTQKKVDLTGAVTQIDDKMIKDRPIDNVGQALQGVVPNLNINFSNGRPGAPAKVNIRGFTSVNGGQPLVLIDGIPGDINLVNPNDIATVTVLKDASSAAIYGARAAYGVILITTKSGKSGKLQVTYSANFASSSPTTSHSFMTDGYATAKLIDSAFKITTGNVYTGYSAADYDSLKIRQTDHSLPSVTIQNRNGKNQYVWYGNTDWWRYFFLNSLPSMSHSLEFSGGSENITFMVSGRYYQQKGMLNFNGDKYTDYNLRAKVHAKIKPWLTIDNNLSFDANVYNWPGWRPVDQIFTYLGVHMLPSYVPVNPDGTFTYRSNLNNYGMADGYNLELESGKSISQQKEFDLTNTFSVVITPIPSLSIQASYSYDLNPYSQFHRSVVTPWSINPGVINEFNNDNYNEEMDLDQYHVASAYATYHVNFGRHALKIMGGYDQEYKKYHVLRGAGNDLLSQDLNALDLATSGQTVGSNSVAWALLGIFGRINYSYKNKYLLELDARRDGSSHFPAKSRFGIFPSVSAGWRMSEEPFFTPARGIVSELKLRGSYGELGNQSLSTNLRNDDYPYIPLMSTGLSTWLQGGNEIQYLRVGAPVPPELTWERTLSADGGIDFGFFNDHLTGSFDWYDRKTLDMLVAGPTLPAVFGAASPKANSANLDTKGWGVSVQWSDNTKIGGKTFTYTAGFVLSNFISHITEFNNPTKLLNNYYVGQRIGDIWGYTVDGFFKTDDDAKNYKVNQDYVNRERLQSPGTGRNLQAGDMKFIDLNGDGVVNNGENTLANHGDLKIIGNNLPRLPFGINGSVGWNGFSISVFFQGVGHQDWYPGNESYMFWGPYGRPYYTFIPKDIESKMWTPQNPNAYFPKLRGYVALNGNSELTVPNTMYLQNIAYIRLKNLTIGYTLPVHILKALKVQNIHFYLSGENIFTATPLKSKYIDPEQVSADPNGTVANISARNYPFMKTYSGGFNITF